MVWTSSGTKKVTSRAAWSEPRAMSLSTRKSWKRSACAAAALAHARLMVESRWHLSGPPSPKRVGTPGVFRRSRRLSAAQSSRSWAQLDRRMPGGDQVGECVLKSPM